MVKSLDKHGYAVATMDTKGEEIQCIARLLREAGVSVQVVDVGTQSAPLGTPDISRDDVLACADGALGNTEDRGQAVTRMGEALRKFLLRECAKNRIDGCRYSS